VGVPLHIQFGPALRTSVGRNAHTGNFATSSKREDYSEKEKDPNTRHSQLIGGRGRETTKKRKRRKRKWRKKNGPPSNSLRDTAL